jgi:ribosomal-protein-alanine N-acetyltransferase
MSTTSFRHQIHFRRPTQDDLPALLMIEQDCFLGYYRAHRFSKSHFNDYLRSTRAIFLVARQPGSLVGYIAGYVKAARATHSARIESIAVRVSVRRRGTGSRLMQLFTDEVKRQGCHTITLEVAAANEEAMRLFSRQGFTPVRRLPAYYSPRHDGILMKLKL